MSQFKIMHKQFQTASGRMKSYVMTYDHYSMISWYRTDKTCHLRAIGVQKVTKQD